jgi:glycolate oxidase iron-sulfur subunit
MTPPDAHPAAGPIPGASTKGFLDSRKSLACIHCGLCLSSCPTYLETGDENNSPRGRIHLMKALESGRLDLDEGPVRHLDLCLGCRACESACPSGVEYGALLESTREFIEMNHPRPAYQRFLRRVLIERIFPHPERMEILLGPAVALKRLGIARWLPRFMRDALALLPNKLVAENLPDFSPAQRGGQRRGQVGFIRGCVMSVMFGDTNEATVRLLNRAGYDVIAPREQGCCGALHAHGGNLERARDAARRNIAAFDVASMDAIIINAAGCGSTLKEYAHLLAADPVWAARAEAFGRKVRDLSEWLVGPAEFKPSSAAQSDGRTAGSTLSRAEGSGKVTFHDACHLAHAQRITHAPRQLVRAVAGENLVELPEADVCCGSAGSYNLTEPGMAERLQHRKVENILKTGAQLVVSTNPGCLLQIRAGLDRAGAGHIRTMHLADYLDSSTD